MSTEKHAEIERRWAELEPWEKYHILPLIDAIGPVSLCCHTEPVEWTITKLDEIYAMWTDYVFAKAWKGPLP